MLRKAITEDEVVTSLPAGRAAQGKVLSHQCRESSLHMLSKNALEALELMGAVGQLFMTEQQNSYFLFLSVVDKA